MSENKAYDRLFEVAKRGTGQSEDVAEFLLAWYNVRAWGGWAPHRIYGLDRAIREDILSVLRAISQSLWYPDSDDMYQLIEMYRAGESELVE